MAHIKKFEEFIFNDAPVKEPNVKPSEPVTKPGTRPGRPSPIRRSKPAVLPKPKAEKNNKPVEASIEDVVYKYMDLANKEKENGNEEL